MCYVFSCVISHWIDAYFFTNINRLAYLRYFAFAFAFVNLYKFSYEKESIKIYILKHWYGMLMEQCCQQKK